MFPVQLEYTAPPGCPTQTEFVALVASRGGDFAKPGVGTKARGMAVTLRRGTNEHQGSLQLRQDDAPSDARELRAETCVEVAEGLAVVAAIALRGADEATPAVAAETAPAAAPAPATAPALVTPAPAAPKAPSETRLRAISFSGKQEIPVKAGPLRVGRELVPTLSAGAVFGAVPGVVLPRYDLTLMRTNFITTPEGSSFLIGNVFGARWSYLSKVTKRVSGYSTELDGFNAGVVSCNSITYDSAGFVAMLCANFMVGLAYLETTEAASGYKQVKDVGLGLAGLELNTRYNIGKYFHLNLAAGGDIWLSKLAAERPDGSELFPSRIFNVNFQFGAGAQF